ncbi:hypothetical protein N9998_00995 [Nitrosopumilus sp.]|nr:hypothetical protein [Nitrosopumilus sp.]
MASKAQREIFEQYFYDINRFNKMPGNSTEFSDMLYILEEKIAHFRVDDVVLTNTALYIDDFEVDITGWNTSGSANGIVSHVAPASTNSYNGGIKILQNANSGIISAQAAIGNLTAGKKYKASWTIIDMSEPQRYGVALFDAGSTHTLHDFYDPSVGAFSFTFEADSSNNYIIRFENDDVSDAGKYITVGEVKVEEVDNATLASNVYRLGDVSWTKSGAAYPITAFEVTANQIKKYNASPLARPTSSNPTYVRTGETSIKLYPTPTSTDIVTYSYVKIPTDPYWGYVVVPSSSGGSEYPLYDSTTATHFELHESEEPTLVNRILEMSGVTMKQPDVVQYGSTKNNEEFQKENS